MKLQWKTCGYPDSSLGELYSFTIRQVISIRIFELNEWYYVSVRPSWSTSFTTREEKYHSFVEAEKLAERIITAYCQDVQRKITPYLGE